MKKRLAEALLRLIEWIFVITLAAGIFLTIGMMLGGKVTQGRMTSTAHYLDTILVDILADIRSGNIEVAKKKLGVLSTNKL